MTRLEGGDPVDGQESGDWTVGRVIVVHASDVTLNRSALA